MSTKNIYVPEDLRRWMREFPGVNWSAVAQKAWAKHVEKVKGQHEEKSTVKSTDPRHSSSPDARRRETRRTEAVGASNYPIGKVNGDSL